MTSTRTNFAESRRIDALIFVDGVEVPFSSFEVAFALDQPSTISIDVEPDAALDQWRPRSQIHVFVRLPFAEATRNENIPAHERDVEYDKKTFALYWEGELVGLSDVESADQRYTQLKGVDTWNVPYAASLSLVGLTNDLQVPLVNGSSFYGDITDSDGTEVVSAILAYLFRKPAANAAPADLPTISKVAVELLQYLAMYNASYGLQAVRTRLFSRITSIADATLQKFIEQTQAENLIRQDMTRLDAGTVGSLLTSVLQKFFHHTTTIPFPVPAGEPKAGFKSLAIIPNLYNAIPPFCNWIFPDQYVNRQVDRSFLSEPTRLGLRTGLMTSAGDMLHVAPYSLLESIGLANSRSAPNANLAYGSQPDAAVVPSATQDLLKRFEDVGFYAVDATGAVTADNLLQRLTTDELEKGIIFQEDTNEYAALLARAALNKDDVLPTAEMLKQRRNAYVSDSAKPGSYAYYMRWLAEYQLMFRKLSRTVSIAGPFNPWPVVGLPVIIARENRSYRGLLVALFSRIDYSGQSQTSYTIEYGQLLRTDKQSDAVGAGIEATRAKIQAARTSANAAEEELGRLVANDASLEELAAAANELNNLLAFVGSHPIYRSFAEAMSKLAAVFPRYSSLATSMITVRYYSGLLKNISGSTLAMAVDLPVQFQLALTDHQKSLIDTQLRQRFDGENPYIKQCADLFVLAYEVMRALYVVGIAPPSTDDQLARGTTADYDSYTQLCADVTRLTAELAVIEKDFEAARVAYLAAGSALTQYLELYEGAPLGDSSEFTKLSDAAQQAKVLYDGLAQTLVKTSAELSDTKKQITDAWAIDWVDTLQRINADALGSGQPTVYNIETGALWSIGIKNPPKIVSDVQISAALDSFFAAFAARKIPPGLLSLQEEQPIYFDKQLSRLADEFLYVTQLVPASGTAISNLGLAVDAASESLAKVTDEVNTRGLDIPPIMPFTNQEITKVATAEKALSALVVPENAETTYTGLAAANDVALIQKFEDDIGGFNPDVGRITALRYDAFVRTIRRVYPFAAEDVGTTLYEDARREGSTHRWINKLQARKVVTLENFATYSNTGLQLRQVAGTFGLGSYYVLATPNKPTTGTYALNTYFSKLGSDAKENSKLNKSLTEVADAVGRRPGAMLAEAERQAIVEAYTKRHAVAALIHGKK